MSHRATNWLSSLPADALGSSEFRILFHLCDCHNPARGCFPTQAYLINVTGVSNGTLNNALAALEEKGLIKRHSERDRKTKRQKPTRYTLGFEMGESGEPTPETGDGNGPEPTPETGDGADSRKRAKPSPTFGKSRLQWAGEKPVKEPVKNRASAGEVLEFWARIVRDGGFVPDRTVSAEMAGQMMGKGLIAAEQAAAFGWQAGQAKKAG